MELFTVEKMYRLPEAGSLKAFADVCIGDAITIKGCRIIESKKGLIVSMPQEMGKDNHWYDQVVFKKPELYEDFSRVLIKCYKEVP